MADDKSDDPEKPQDPREDGGKLREKLKMQGTFSQQLLIIFVAVAVGVLFGMGPALALLRGGGAQAAGIEGTDFTTADVQRLQRTADNLQTILNPRLEPWRGEVFVKAAGTPFGFRRYPAEQAFGLWERDLRDAAIAERQGLMPDGEALDRIFEEFKHRTLPGEDRHYGDILTEHLYGRFAVKPEDLRYYLQITYAARALHSRHFSHPTPPPNLGGIAARLQMDQIPYRRVVLSSRTLIDRETKYLEAAAEDTEAQRMLHDRFSDSEAFRIPAKVTVTLITVAAGEVGQKVAISQEDIATYYEANKEDFRKPEGPDVNEETGETEETGEPADGEETDDDGESGPRYQSLEEVAPDIRIRLEVERGERVVEMLVQALGEALGEAGLKGNPEATTDEVLDVVRKVKVGPDDHPNLEEEVGFEIVHDLVVEEPGPDGRYRLGGNYGSIEASAIDLLSKAKGVGYLSMPYTPPDQPGRRVLVRIEDKQPEGVRSREEVEEVLIRQVAARKAWEDLLARAEELRGRAAEAGSLAALFAEDEALRTFWNVEEVEERTGPPLQPVVPPPEDLDIQPAEGEPLISYAPRVGEEAAVGPVVVALDGVGEGPHDFPAVALIQATGYEEAADIAPGMAMRSQRHLRYVIQSLLAQRFRENLAAEE